MSTVLNPELRLSEDQALIAKLEREVVQGMAEADLRFETEQYYAVQIAKQLLEQGWITLELVEQKIAEQEQLPLEMLDRVAITEAWVIVSELLQMTQREQAEFVPEPVDFINFLEGRKYPPVMKVLGTLASMSRDARIILEDGKDRSLLEETIQRKIYRLHVLFVLCNAAQHGQRTFERDTSSFDLVVEKGIQPNLALNHEARLDEFYNGWDIFVRCFQAKAPVEAIDIVRSEI